MERRYVVAGMYHVCGGPPDFRLLEKIVKRIVGERKLHKYKLLVIGDLVE